MKINYPKITIKIANLYNKYSWSINILPFLNIGNDEWDKKAFVINIGWITWIIYIHVSFKKHQFKIEDDDGYDAHTAIEF